MFSVDVLSTSIAVVVAILSIAFIGTLIGIYIYKKAHHIPTGECAHCHASKNSLVKAYHKKYGIKK